MHPGAFVLFALAVFAVGYLGAHILAAIVGWQALGIAAGLSLYVALLAATYAATTVRGGGR